MISPKDHHPRPQDVMFKLFVVGLLLTSHHLPVVESLDNGVSLLPQMGWRTWNAFHMHVNQTALEEVFGALVLPRTMHGEVVVVSADVAAAAAAAAAPVHTSLASLGYIYAGLDDGWQACGQGVNRSFHDKDGNPLVDLKVFPSFKNMTIYGHSLGLRMGWYLNNCICGENHFDAATAALVYKQSALAVAGM